MKKTTRIIRADIGGMKRMKLKPTLPFLFFSLLYRGILANRKFLYKLGIFKTHRLPCKVISVGNITVGGTGKTPAVCDIARRITQTGKSVVILSRGYRRQSKEPVLIASDGEGSILPWEKIGDEPAMMAQTLQGVPLVVGAERARSGRVAIERFAPDILLLDDAYQHLGVHRDLNILVIDAANPFGNRHVLPGGILRESLANLDRADAFLLSRTDQAANPGKLASELEQFKKPIFKSAHRPAFLIEIVSGRKEKLDTQVSKKWFGFSGIGSPSSFRETLLALNYTLVGEKTFPDHYAYTPRDIREIKQKSAAKGADYLITTEKDAVRLPKDCLEGIWALAVRLQIVGDETGWGKLIEMVI
jgi:tetraacyldisaccharide 4'-kinase